MHREPDVGFDLGSPGLRPGPKAGAKPLRHPGIPRECFNGERSRARSLDSERWPESGKSPNFNLI